MMTKSSGTILDGERRPEGRGAGTRPRNWVRGVGLASGFALLTACSVGPDYKRPSVDTAAGFKEANSDWKPTEPADAINRGPWWLIFNDEVLNGLEDKIDISNQNVKSAAAQVENARALVREAEAGFIAQIV